MEINAMFRDASLASDDYSETLSRQSRLVAALAAKDGVMAHVNWRLTGDSLEEASLYHAFDETGAPSTPALAVLNERSGHKKRKISHAAIWNVEAGADDGAAMSCFVSDAKVLPDRISLDIDSPRCCASFNDMADIVRAVVDAFHPLVVEVSPKGYFEKQVFDDKPGVGWMIYLPAVITQQQVPEARALVPIPDAGKAQTGTIVVSTTDAPFSMKNPERIETANRIEIRLVDRDLLPAFADL
ncbi:immunity 52 family protein [Burkholderia multivorans]|uniref:immunity 52 family protein n=1 Tax=Burkholderia multivorans TaxID=87883 RepID=UPI00143E651B|nr:immunity 52 family protein [Burkholderia multivorans]MBU9464549.1 immunity 52 family protein [Burkholderia multivorans]MCA8125371.1 immunity 52 family protein [Burkholderia multivorans]QIX18067.1 LysR family transcriptional regulator [Burkholderia multivorans]